MTVLVNFVREAPGAPQVTGVVDISRPPSGSLISCIMPTRGFAFPARLAIDCFCNQTYPNRELVIVSATVDSEVKALVAQLRDPRIRMIEAPDAQTVGALRNAAIAEAEGDLISIWDDDDLSHADRLWWQSTGLDQVDGDACFLSNVILWWPARTRLAISSTLWTRSRSRWGMAQSQPLTPTIGFATAKAPLCGLPEARSTPPA